MDVKILKFGKKEDIEKEYGSAVKHNKFTLYSFDENDEIVFNDLGFPQWVVDMASEEDLKKIDWEKVKEHFDFDVYGGYTRPYLTRHGDGNISSESLRCELSEHVNEDRTNHFNDAQGDFRFGKLDLKKLKTRIEHNADNKVKYEIELTHCDEMDRVAEFKNLFDKVNVYDTPLV